MQFVPPKLRGQFIQFQAHLQGPDAILVIIRESHLTFYQRIVVFSHVRKKLLQHRVRHHHGIFCIVHKAVCIPSGDLKQPGLNTPGNIECTDIGVKGIHPDMHDRFAGKIRRNHHFRRALGQRGILHADDARAKIGPAFPYPPGLAALSWHNGVRAIAVKRSGNGSVLLISRLYLHRFIGCCTANAQQQAKQKYK